MVGTQLLRITHRLSIQLLRITRRQLVQPTRVQAITRLHQRIQHLVTIHQVLTQHHQPIIHLLLIRLLPIIRRLLAQPIQVQVITHRLRIQHHLITHRLRIQHHSIQRHIHRQVTLLLLLGQPIRAQAISRPIQRLIIHLHPMRLRLITRQVEPTQAHITHQGVDTHRQHQVTQHHQQRIHRRPTMPILLQVALTRLLRAVIHRRRADQAILIRHLVHPIQHQVTPILLRLDHTRPQAMHTHRQVARTQHRVILTLLQVVMPHQVMELHRTQRHRMVLLLTVRRNIVHQVTVLLLTVRQNTAHLRFKELQQLTLVNGCVTCGRLVDNSILSPAKFI